jgi:predicted nucleic acid-binding protein
MRVVIDSSVFVGLVNPLDHRRAQAISLLQAIQARPCTLFYLDCVGAESITTILRRLSEQQRSQEIDEIFNRLQQMLKPSQIVWVFPEVPQMFQEILALMQMSNGSLNFNDALIALACRAYGVPAIASFDTDFDQIPWLRRLALPGDVAALTDVTAG